MFDNSDRDDFSALFGSSRLPKELQSILSRMFGDDSSDPSKVDQQELTRLKTDPDFHHHCERCTEKEHCATFQAYLTWKERDRLEKAAATSPLAALQFMLPEIQVAIEQATAKTLDDRALSMARAVEVGVRKALADDKALENIKSAMATGVADGLELFVTRQLKRLWAIITWPFKAAWWLISLLANVFLFWPIEFVASAVLWKRHLEKFQEAKRSFSRLTTYLPEDILNRLEKKLGKAEDSLPFVARQGYKFGRWVSKVSRNARYQLHSYKMRVSWFFEVTVPNWWEDKITSRFSRHQDTNSEVSDPDSEPENKE